MPRGCNYWHTFEFEATSPVNQLVMALTRAGLAKLTSSKATPTTKRPQGRISKAKSPREKPSNTKRPREESSSLKKPATKVTKGTKGSRRPAPTSETNKSKPQTSTVENTKLTITAYSPKFKLHLTSHGIYLDQYERICGRPISKPGNFEELLEIASRSRRAVSPHELSTKDFENFKKLDTVVSNESAVLTMVLPLIDGDTEAGGRVIRDHHCGNFAPMTNDKLVVAKPDLLYGSPPEQLRPIIRDELDDMIIPSTYKHYPMLPNFFMEVKGPDGSPAVAVRQACYDGAIGARGMHALQLYKNDSPTYDMNAYTITGTYQCGHLRLYTTHIEPPINGEGCVEYIMTSLCSYSIVNNLDTFRQGICAYRNLRDWARRQRDLTIAAANDRYANAQD